MQDEQPLSPRPFQFSVRAILVFTLLLGAILGVTIPMISAAREAARRMECSNNLKQIAYAMQNYNDVYRCLPMATRNDAAGQPAHSWRIAILPFATQTPGFDAYDFSQPWDSEQNLAVFYKPMTDPLEPNRTTVLGTPRYCRCPSCGDVGKSKWTNYVLITGPGTLFPDGKQLNFADVTDGTSHTILAVEVDHPDIHWLKPWDLSIDTMSFRINDPTRPSISSRHPGGAHVAFVDGSVYFVSEQIDPEMLRALITIDGGEDVTPKQLIDSGILR